MCPRPSDLTALALKLALGGKVIIHLYTISFFVSIVSMAPLLIQSSYHDSSEDVFSLWPLKMELDATVATSEFRAPPAIRFDNMDDIINPMPEYYSDDDIRIRWYTMDELQQIKQQAKEYSSTIRQSNSSQVSCLCSAHRKTSLMLKSDFKSLVKLSQTTPDQDLSEWCSFEDGRRGLERFSSRDYAAFRRSDINLTRTSVIEEFARQRTMLFFDYEAVANHARDASRRARTFARFFAEADAGASKKTQRDDIPPVRTTPSRSVSELRPASRRLPPRKRSKQYHREEFYPTASS